MADLTAISNVAPFQPDVDPTNTAQRWQKWASRFDNLMIALNITDHTRKKALLLHLAGESVCDIFEGLVLTEIPEDADQNVINKYTVAREALDKHFSPKKNVEFERYTFRTARQNADENIDAYHVRLRTLTKYCDFPNVNDEIKSHIIQTCQSTRLRRRALSDATLTLTGLLDLGRSMETACSTSHAGN
jgi:hypothetical protein